MKKDIFNHATGWENFKKQLTPKYIEEGLTKENSKLFIDYLLDLEQGRNIPRKAIKGGRDTKHLNRLRNKMRAIFKLFQNNGIKDTTKITEKQVSDIFTEWTKTHTVDYAKRFKAFWSWWMTKNRREGKIVEDVCIDLSTTEKNNGDRDFVWVTKEQLDKLRTYFDEDKQTILLFCFDSIIRSPTELMSLKTENIYEKGDEVWIDIPNSISKTIGRKFNLVYAGKPILDYIKRHHKQQGEYLFEFSHLMLTKEMQKIAKQLWDGKKSEGGEFFKNITLYDLRHSGAIHFRQLFQKTGQSLDILRERGGWSDFKMINYYTRRLGLDGHISKEKLLLEEDKTKIEKEVIELKEQLKNLRDTDLKEMINNFYEEKILPYANKQMKDALKIREKRIKKNLPVTPKAMNNVL